VLDQDERRKTRTGQLKEHYGKEKKPTDKFSDEVPAERVGSFYFSKLIG
jgi:hypothetical protein